MNIAQCVLSCCVAITAHMPWKAAIAHPAAHFIPNPTPADEVAFFQLFRRQYWHAKTDRVRITITTSIPSQQRKVRHYRG